MINQEIVAIIKNEELAHWVVQRLLGRKEIESHKVYSEALLFDRTYDIFCLLGYWLDRGRTNADLDNFFQDLAKKRFHDGIPLHESVLFVLLLKRHLWLHLLENHFFESSLELMNALELNNRVVLFFDRAVLMITKAYESAFADEIRANTDSFLKRFFK